MTAPATASFETTIVGSATKTGIAVPDAVIEQPRRAVAPGSKSY